MSTPQVEKYAAAQLKAVDDAIIKSAVQFPPGIAKPHAKRDYKRGVETEMRALLAPHDAPKSVARFCDVTAHFADPAMLGRIFERAELRPDLRVIVATLCGLYRLKPITK